MAVVLVARGVPSDPPAAITLAAAVIPAGWTIGRAIGYALDVLKISRRISDLNGDVVGWEQALGAGGSAVGVVIFLIILTRAALEALGIL